MRGQLRQGEPTGVNAKTQGLLDVIQITYPDSDHLLIQGVNGANGLKNVKQRISEIQDMTIRF